VAPGKNWGSYRVQEVMMVLVQFHGIQRLLTRTHEVQVPLLKGRRVRDVFLYIRNCYPDLSLSEKAVMITVNDNVSAMNALLNPNDKISFLPHIGGG
jgi:molybdopterin converting factor small subunit